MALTVSWTSFATAKSLVNVGTEAVCTLCDNILCFSDLKTKAISYYKAESPAQGLSISTITGHNRFSLVAFSEVVLRPAIHIIQYPQLSKYAVFTSNDILTFVDLHFTEYDLLIALSGYPHYTICIWNFRTGQLLCQVATMKESLSYSLQCSGHHIPQIVQYSEWNHQLMIWEMCYSATDVNLHEISHITLGTEYALCNALSLCYGEDNNLYIVDNFGAVSMVQVGQFFLKPQWSVDNTEDAPKQYQLSSHKQGLLVHCKDAIYYIKKKINVWTAEWIVNDFLNIEIFKIISNINGDIFASGDLGNLYQFDTSNDQPVLTDLYTFNQNCIDFVILKAVKEECLVQLTYGNRLRAVEMDKINIYSELEIPDANTIVGHNVEPYVVVGTSTGKLHFLNYANVSEPQEVGVIETDNGYALAGIQLLDDVALYHNIYYDFYLVKADFQQNKFFEMAPLIKVPEAINVSKFFLSDGHRALMFVNRDEELKIPHARELWCFSWNLKKKEIIRHDYELPHAYRDISDVLVPAKDIVEFMGVRLESCIIDILNLNSKTNELLLLSSMQTPHLCNIIGISGARNLLTWGIDGTYVHFRTHKKSTKPYAIGQMLQNKYHPRVVQKVMESLNSKYLVYLYSAGGIKVMKIDSSVVPLTENIYLNSEIQTMEHKEVHTMQIESIRSDVIVEHTPEEIQARDQLLQQIQEFAKEVTELIDYDISVTGKTHGIYKKFCLHHKWLEILLSEAQKLCEVEKNSLERAIEDQSRIRDWIRNLIMANSNSITFKVRAIFSNFSFENYGMRRSNDRFAKLYDLYRFYGVENIDEENEEDEELMELQEASGDNESIGRVVVQATKKRKYLYIQGSAYDHIISDELALQDIDSVTANQMYNHDAKVRILLTDRLKEEFNKRFEDIRKIKFELMEAILSTNNTLNKIYDNMNCMLRLLKMDTFQPPKLSVPEWSNDEFIQRIMEVDDSEIKAINRRKKKAEITTVKHGRLLLWSVDFWVRSLMIMMDGVLEKLWEEEIKKEIPIPEFMLKKEVTEYTLEDQKALREYEEKVRILTEDRRKYLKILTENDARVNEMKSNYILKLNEQITQMMIIKLKYDFAIKHVRLRNLNIKVMYFKKLQWLKRISLLRANIDKISEYVLRYTKLSECWSKSVEELKAKGETLMQRDRVIERQFKTQYLNMIPQHMGPEMNKIFKKRPKMPPKILHSTLMCKELSARVNTKALPKYPFPLPKDVTEYLDTLTSLDDVGNMTNTLESRHWEQLTKMRRQKIEIELRIKAVNLQLADSIAGMNYFSKELQNLKNTKTEAQRQLQEAQEEYLKSVQNQTLELRLTMGQVELNIMGSMEKLQNCILMHVDDINDINALI
ncbi:uncharacterized protein LOC133324712 [Musca vetustissima]|uniref:uncharacterized protein LOC133324712 n=1 Tax=Musca vetustissima TaxID=27455 RepID=UPI002AB6FCEA|nr:uncharacterized protein LOC133324712 [Musca vetustissima]